MHQARCLPVEALEEDKQLGRTGFQLQQKKRFFHRSSFSCANSSDHVYLTPTYDAACSFVSSGALCTASGMYFGRLRQALVHILTTNALGRRPRPYSTYSSTVSARARNRSVRVNWYARFTRVQSSNLSTQLRRTRTSNTVSPPVPTTVATIALHTEQEKIRNLQEAQVSQRRTLSFLAG